MITYKHHVLIALLLSGSLTRAQLKQALDYLLQSTISERTDKYLLNNKSKAEITDHTKILHRDVYTRNYNVCHMLHTQKDFMLALIFIFTFDRIKA